MRTKHVSEQSSAPSSADAQGLPITIISTNTLMLLHVCKKVLRYHFDNSKHVYAPMPKVCQ
jgi:hypothetical protein